MRIRKDSDLYDTAVLSCLDLAKDRRLSEVGAFKPFGEDMYILPCVYKGDIWIT